MVFDRSSAHHNRNNNKNSWVEVQQQGILLLRVQAGSASRYRAGHSLSSSVVCRRIDKAPSPSEQRRHGPAHVIIIIIVINIVVVMNCSE